MSGLHVRGLRARHPHGPEVLHGVSFTAAPGSVTAVLGPNGAGKSTLLKAILGLVPAEGALTLHGVELASLDRRARAQRLAYVPQRARLTARLSVREVVAQGRFCHRGWGPRVLARDAEAVARAMADAGATPLAERAFSELSGGEQQRVLLARALATGATTLLLDEPTAALDVRQTLLFERRVRALAERGACALVVLHDLDEARRLADQVLLLDRGRLAFAGSVDATLAPGPVRAVYGVDLLRGVGLGYRLGEEAG